MIDVIKVSLVFVVLLIFLRFKCNVGYVLLIAAALLAVLYQMSLQAITSTVSAAVTDPITVQLFFALTLIRVLEMVLREKQVLARMTEASRHILRKKKAVIISMPMLIGLLPSLGGAYFSAPMVKEATRGLDMSSDEKGFINYWFRHPWEYVLPLYPGILLAAAISGMEIRSLILANGTFAFLIIATGFMFSMRGIGGARADDGPQNGKSGPSASPGEPLSGRFPFSDLVSFLPLTAVLLLVIVFHVELYYSLGITILGLFVFYRFGGREILRVLKHGFALEVIVLIFGTMVFKFCMENSGAVVRLSLFFAEKGIPLLPVLFALPFLTGLLTGLTVGFVGSTFPLLISLGHGANLNQIVFAFVSGYTGVLLSPVHLCLVLTREYFGANVWGMYKRILPACGIIMAVALAGYFVL